MYSLGVDKWQKNKIIIIWDVLACIIEETYLDVGGSRFLRNVDTSSVHVITSQKTITLADVLTFVTRSHNLEKHF
jgi:hypothetical protein